ncbi:peptidoglycan DD-metalloendopeptidase family protein [Desulfuribacillus alkaliarsenatis]|uniref:LysM domain-containing protein n=1 Tax=Desulfuribacillus alkaliarsenatis TaxID=766136 RepID=A0A1E5G2J8_9FIRM|nr:M23 family metallopeptidase [Desulfuribacillus alkaliarsenatis]OEF96761.1 hypothetical protein BHF68_06735 [Desulfuribacillus alkaliarsenatis]
MKKVQALPVFLSFLLMSSVVLAPMTTSALSLRDFYNPFHTINEYIEKEKYARQVDSTVTALETNTSWRELPLHTEYQVKANDTLQSIAQLYKIARADLQESNPWATDPLELGQVIYVPLAVDRVHHVSWGDTIFTIAQRYGVSISDLLVINPSLDIEALTIDQEVRIPKERKQTVQLAASVNQKNFNNPMKWPVIGVLTSYYGPRWGRFHQGIDIWHQSEFQTPIYASLPGDIVFADWSGSGYGRLVIVDHGNGIQTYYAHLSRILVSEGQKVRQGDIIGHMGDSGDSIGIHLHFELRVDEQPVNPLLYLP